jgi:hypothetical protein
MAPTDGIPAAETGPRYNPIYEKLVSEEDDDPDLVGLVAYALYKRAKRNWARDFRERRQRKPNDTDLDAYVDTWTADRLEGVKREAASALAEYANTVMASAEPDILRRALRGAFWRAVWPSMAASVLYTVILIIFAVILARAGVDLIGIVRTTATK